MGAPMPYIIRPKARYLSSKIDVLEFFYRTTNIHPNHATTAGARRLARNGYKVLSAKKLRRVMNRIHIDKT